MMKDKIVYCYLVPLLLRIPILRILGQRLALRKLVSTFVWSVNEYHRVLHDDVYIKYPILRVPAAMLAIMPAVAIVYALQVKGNKL